MADSLFGDGGLKLLLELFLKADDLAAVHRNALLRLAVGQFDNVDGLELGEQLVHLLLAVAGRLADDEIGEVEEWALIRLGKAVARLDERAQVARQILFRVGNGLVGDGAQSHHGSAHRVRDLLGQIRAEHADDRRSLILELLDGQEGVAALVREFLKHSR